MTFKELDLCFEAYKENSEYETQKRRNDIYNIAYLTASFVGLSLNGKSIPSESEIFDGKDKEQEDNSLALLKEKMIDFAQAANKKRNKK